MRKFLPQTPSAEFPVNFYLFFPIKFQTENSPLVIFKYFCFNIETKRFRALNAKILTQSPSAEFPVNFYWAFPAKFHTETFSELIFLSLVTAEGPKG